MSALATQPITGGLFLDCDEAESTRLAITSADGAAVVRQKLGPGYPFLRAGKHECRRGGWDPHGYERYLEQELSKIEECHHMETEHMQRQTLTPT